MLYHHSLEKTINSTEFKKKSVLNQMTLFAYWECIYLFYASKIWRNNEMRNWFENFGNISFYKIKNVGTQTSKPDPSIFVLHFTFCVFLSYFDYECYIVLLYSFKRVRLCVHSEAVWRFSLSELKTIIVIHFGANIFSLLVIGMIWYSNIWLIPAS